MSYVAQGATRAKATPSWLAPLFGLLAALLVGAVVFSGAAPAQAVVRTWTLTSTTFSGPEGSAIEIGLTRTGSAGDVPSGNEDTTIELTFVGITAVRGTDYTVSELLTKTFSVGTEKNWTATLDTIANSDPDDKTLTVQITAIDGSPLDDDLIGSPDTATITIVDINSPEPTITGISPHRGPIEGGTEVTITGTNLTGALCSKVKFGTKSAQPGTCIFAANQIKAKTPSVLAPIEVDVSVETEGGLSQDTSADNFEYTDGPRVTDVSPRSGSVDGGTTVTITGSGFSSTKSQNLVEFGTISIATGDIITASPTQLVVEAPPALDTGTVSIRVTVGLPTSPNTPDDDYTYSTGPTVTGLTPTNAAAGATVFVNITGTGFSTDSCQVKFGTTVVVSSRDGATPTTKISAVVNGNIGAGTVDVTVTCNSLTSPTSAASKFTFNAVGLAPTVTSLSPNSGPANTANIEVTIAGTNLGSTTSVTFGGTNGTIVGSATANQVKVIAPAMVAGKVEVVVNTFGGSSSTAGDANDFTYTAANVPTVTSLSPSNGPLAGGNSVSITGTNFTGATEVKFGALAASGVVVSSSTSITATAPNRGSAGTVKVTVKTAAGTSSESGSGNDYTYQTGPATLTLSLSFRWTLLAWGGKNNIAVADALRGLESPDVPATNNILSQVSVLFLWSPNGVGCPAGVTQCYLGHFPNAGNVPGVNDFITLVTGNVYWLAIFGPGSVTWTILGP